MEQFEEWLMNLQPQILDEQLKLDIMDQVEIMNESHTMEFESFYMWVWNNNFRKDKDGWQKITNDAKDWPYNLATVTLTQLREQYRKEIDIL